MSTLLFFLMNIIESSAIDGSTLDRKFTRFAPIGEVSLEFCREMYFPGGPSIYMADIESPSCSLSYLRLC